MGYYSDVRISTTQEGFGFIKEHYKPESYAPELDRIYGYIEDANDEDGVVFGWNWTKWYDDFPEVIALARALEEADEAGIPWEYLVLGEGGEHEMLESETSDELVYHLEVSCRINHYW